MVSKSKTLMCYLHIQNSFYFQRIFCTILLFTMLLFVGKPIMDIIVKVDDIFLNKYGLKANDATKANQSQANIFRDILTLNAQFVPGGSVMNTLRVFKLASENNAEVFFFGVIGKDNFGDIIKRQLKKENVKFYFWENSLETVQCAVLVTNNGKNRSLVTNTNFISSQEITRDSFSSSELREQIHKSNYVYVTCFSLVLFSYIIKEIIEEYVLANKKIIVNLGAVYILEQHSENVKNLVKHADVVIGNDEEYKTLAKILNLSAEDLKELLTQMKIQNFAEKPEAIFVVTRGHEDILTYENEKFAYFEVPSVADVVDTTGAGDAFAGGFLSEYVKGLPLETCVSTGMEYASRIIQRIGCDID